MSFLSIKPNDTLFFRSGKPFTAGEDSWTNSSFLPYPSVIWGSLFSILFFEGKVSIDDSEKLQVKNLYLFNENKQVILVPCPLDIFIDDDKKLYIPEYKDIEDKYPYTNYPLKVLNFVTENRKVKPLENTFIEINSLFKYYARGYYNSMVLYDFEDIFVADYKIGIKRKRSKTSDEAFLYRIDLAQFREDWSFLVEYELKDDIDFPEQGILKLGGEGKTASYRIVDVPSDVLGNRRREEAEKELETRRFIKIVFKTPVYFENGWKPNIDPICADVGKPLYIGGYDMKEKKPKPMRKYVPPGSIYIFEKDKFDANKLICPTEELNKGFGKFEKLFI